MLLFFFLMTDLKDVVHFVHRFSVKHTLYLSEHILNM